MTNPTTQPYVGSGAVVQHKAAEGDVVVFAFKGARVRLDRILKGAIVVRPGPIHKRLPKRLNAATKGGEGERRGRGRGGWVFIKKAKGNMPASLPNVVTAATAVTAGQTKRTLALRWRAAALAWSGLRASTRAQVPITLRSRFASWKKILNA